MRGHAAVRQVDRVVAAPGLGSDVDRTVSDR